MYGRRPYANVNAHALFDLLKEGVRLKQPESCSDELWGILLSCWQEEPGNRPKFEMIVHMLTGKPRAKGFSRGKTIRSKNTIIQDQQMYQNVRCREVHECCHNSVNSQSFNE